MTKNQNEKKNGGKVRRLYVIFQTHNKQYNIHFT